MTGQAMTGQQLWDAFTAAYEERRWKSAIEQGEELLRHLQAGGDAPRIGPLRGGNWLQRVFAEGLCRRLLRKARHNDR